jgi:phosphomannomutase
MAMTVLNHLAADPRPLSEQIKAIARYHATGELNFEVAEKDAAIASVSKHYAEKAKIDFLDGITAEFSDWWFNIRKSNTEPLLRLNLECKRAGDLPVRRAEVEALLAAFGEPSTDH